MGDPFYLSLAILFMATLAIRWGLDRGMVAGWQAKLWLRVALILMGLYLLFNLFPLPYLRPPAKPVLPPPGPISQHQVLIAEIKHLDFSYTPLSAQPRSASPNEFIDFASGTMFQTGKGESGYVFVGLPGRAELFLGPDTQVRLISSDSRGTVLQLEQGRLILNLREDFPAGRRVTVLSAGGAATWLDGSKMCLSYEAATKATRMDCVEDRCGYADSGERSILAGYHVTFTGAEVVEAGAGLRPEACQFVPGVVPASTATPTFMPADPTLDATSQP